MPCFWSARHISRTAWLGPPYRGAIEGMTCRTRTRWDAAPYLWNSFQVGRAANPVVCFDGRAGISALGVILRWILRIATVVIVVIGITVITVACGNLGIPIVQNGPQNR